MPTRIALVVTLVVVVGGVVDYAVRRLDGAVDAADAAPFLWLFTALFAARVLGQVLVVARAPAWLPPMREWNLTPYRLLLPVQLAILGVMVWIDVSFTTEMGAPTDPRPVLGEAILVFTYVYAAAMAARYVVQMARIAESRWFGRTIPIVFHFVLAAYLFVFGSYHASY